MFCSVSFIHSPDPLTTFSAFYDQWVTVTSLLVELTFYIVVVRRKTIMHLSLFVFIQLRLRTRYRCYVTCISKSAVYFPVCIFSPNRAAYVQCLKSGSRALIPVLLMKPVAKAMNLILSVMEGINCRSLIKVFSN